MRKSDYFWMQYQNEPIRMQTMIYEGKVWRVDYEDNNPVQPKASVVVLARDLSLAKFPGLVCGILEPSSH